jgi:sigma-B regulation protein RsbU (phosphoserine phosphatase)
MPYRLLAQVPLFKNLPGAELKRLSTELRVEELPPGSVLFEEGECGDFFYIIREGEFEVLQAVGTPEERVIAVRGPGDFFGELSLFNPDGRRTATVRSKGKAKLWEMSRDEFEELIQRQPTMAYEMAHMLSERLTAAQTATIQELQEKNQQLSQAYEELKAAQAQIIEKERLERELQVAREIQMSILPKGLPQLAGYSFCARIVPARAVGGDFYDLIALSPHQVGIMVGDVTDKGVPAAIYMAQAHALLHAGADPSLTPGEVLQRANRQFLAIGQSALFVTVLYGVLDSRTGEFSYARAGHELPLLRLPTGEVRLSPLNTGQPLGIWDHPMLDEQVMAIPVDGTLLLYTDGITDWQNTAGERFGRERLEERLAAMNGRAAGEVCGGLWQALLSFQGDGPQFDDATLVMVRSIGE